MKKILLPLIFCFIMISCASTRKSVQMSCTSQTNTESAEKQTSKTEKVVDTTKTESGKVTITEIEFYPPTLLPDVPMSGNEETTPCFEIDGVGKVKGGNVKSIKKTSIEAKSESKGQSNDSEETKNEESKAVADKTSNAKIVVEEPVPDPYKWRYIFYITLIGAMALLYIKRQPVLNWIKKLLSGIRRIL